VLQLVTPTPDVHVPVQCHCRNICVTRRCDRSHQQVTCGRRSQHAVQHFASLAALRLGHHCHCQGSPRQNGAAQPHVCSWFLELLCYANPGLGLFRRTPASHKHSAHCWFSTSTTRKFANTQPSLSVHELLSQCKVDITSMHTPHQTPDGCSVTSKFFSITSKTHASHQPIQEIRHINCRWTYLMATAHQCQLPGWFLTVYC
jgi:hypothetical protein